jgi:hypothetical protein
MTVVYEWDVETVTAVESEDHEEGEVMEHNHCRSYAEAVADSLKYPPPEGCRYDIVLVRDDDDGRSWAYMMNDGNLPEFFYDAVQFPVARVPQKFVKEVLKYK